MIEGLIKRVKTVYSSSRLIQKIVNKIAASHIYFYFLQKIINCQIKKDLKGPFNLIIETTSICNARCIMCPHNKMKRSQKVMNKAIFRMIASRLRKEKIPINKVIISGFGEPLIDPEFLSRARTIKDLGYPVKFYTNASLLNLKVSESMVNLGINEINISVNGTTPEIYKKVMGLEFQKTIENINMLVRTKEEKNSKFPIIQISSIITKENKNNISNHLKYWSSRVDSVTVSQPHQWGGGMINDDGSGFEKTDQIYPCRSLWHTVVIDCDGNFVICCRDYESRYKLGNIKTHSFSDIQKSPILRKFRKVHLKYKQKNLPKICKGCNFPYQGGVEWFMPRTID